MNLVTYKIARSYDKNTYNLSRPAEIPQQHRFYIESGYEEMIDRWCDYKDDNDTPIILDLCCGNGVPYTKGLNGLGKVVGVDVSKRQVELARLNVPEGRFIHKDVTELRLRHKYDMIVMMNSFYNVPTLDEQRRLLSRMKGWLADYGVILITTYGEETVFKKTKDFFCQYMYWQHVSPTDFVDMVMSAGLCVIDHEDAVDNVGDKTMHLWTIVKRKETNNE